MEKKKKPLLLRLWWVWMLVAILALSSLGSSRAEAMEEPPAQTQETSVEG